jgi:RsiW-degrading membrane proteinase PrsW (M82 family)
MMGLWILLLIIFISALPVLGALLWFRLIRFNLSPVWFLISLAVGAAALLLAGTFQLFFPPLSAASLGELLIRLFLQIALTEEMGRLLLLLLLFWLRSHLLKGDPLHGTRGIHPPGYPLSFGAATGLLAGLGFAVVENASYGAANLGLILLRVLTAAPLHGACGGRIGMMILGIKDQPVRGAFWFLSAVLIHGMYNFMVINPGIPVVFPIILVLAALIPVIQTIQADRRKKEALGEISD